MNFTHYLPTRVLFGYGSLDSIGTEARALGASRALIVTDSVMVKAGVVGSVASKLAGVTCEVFDGVEPEPGIEVADSVAARVRSGHYDLVIGVGGGSSMDMAKVAAALATNEGPARRYVGNNLFEKKPLQSIMVPTTAGTGAELTVTSMVTVEGHKQWINSPFLLPSAAIVDPELTLTMPKSVTAATGLDALCHNTEAYLSGASNPITDSVALEGIRLIVANLEKAYEDGSDRMAREAMSLAALLGGIALHARMVYGHSVGYTIATRFRLPHGVSCGIPLPYVIASYSVACAPKMKRLGIAFGVDDGLEDPAEIGLAVAERARGLVAAVNVPTSLKDIGVKESDLPALARECIELYPRPNSTLVFDVESMTHLYRMMWEGRLAE
jgi:alcohol dehydrogenase class IV